MDVNVSYTHISCSGLCSAVMPIYSLLVHYNVMAMMMMFVIKTKTSLYCLLRYIIRHFVSIRKIRWAK